MFDYIIISIIITLLVGTIINIKDKSTRNNLGKQLLRIPFIKKKYIDDMKKEFRQFQQHTLEQWHIFGTPIETIPDHAMTVDQVISLIDHYSDITQKELVGKHFSGTIYSKNFYNENENEFIFKDNLYENEDITTNCKKVFTYAFYKSYLWNSLHHNEFKIGSFIDYQIIQMIANIFGKKSDDNIGGFVTSGGTESIMLMARLYRNWGIENKNLDYGDATIIAGKSVHASLMKAGEAYHINIVLIETDEYGNIDMNQMTTEANRYKKQLVAIVASTPSYAKGKIDPIHELAKLAKKYNCGLHIDCCLGGFIINFLEKYDTKYLQIEGVTSISIDTHKNGQSAKGSSVLITTEFDDINLAYYGIYSFPYWSGGIYGTLRDPGSQQCTTSLMAFIAMLLIGKDGYKIIATNIHNIALDIFNILSTFNEIKLLGKPDLNVVAFTLNPKVFKYGASYALAFEMAHRGFILNALNDDSIHFCITARASSDTQILSKFKWALTKSLEVVTILNKENKKFPGDAGLYGTLNSAANPKIQQLGIGKYFENYFFGMIGAKDIVKWYFMALMNPYH